MTLALDASSPAVVGFTQNTKPKTTASFTPPNKCLLCALVAGGGQAAGTTPQTAAITDSLGTLVWSLFGRSNTVVSSGSVLSGDAEAWWAWVEVGAAMTVTGTFSLTPTDTTPAGLLRVVCITGAENNQSSAAVTTGNGQAATAPSLNVVTTRNGSWVWMVTFQWSSATSPTMLTGCTLDATELDASSSDGSWSVRRTNVTDQQGTTETIGASAPIGHWQSVAFEILPSGLVAPTPRTRRALLRR